MEKKDIQPLDRGTIIVVPRRSVKSFIMALRQETFRSFNEIQQAIEKHGYDYEACIHELAYIGVLSTS